MKTFKQIREATTPFKTDALAQAKKLSSTMDVGDIYQSKEMNKRVGVMHGQPGYLPPDMEFWDGEGNFDKTIKDIIRTFKSAGLTHIFCLKDPDEKPGRYKSVWVDSIRLKGNHAKIMLAFEKWWRADPYEIYHEDEGSFYHLTNTKDKPSSEGNKVISKFGVQKPAPMDKLEWKETRKDDWHIAIIKV